MASKALSHLIPGFRGAPARSVVKRALVLCAVVVTISIAIPGIGRAQSIVAQPSLPLDFDPLHRFLPRADLFMQVPGGLYALFKDPKVEGSQAEKQEARHGGIVVGYCLKSSCSRVTHLVALQVCNNRIGGLDGNKNLVLGVIKLPWGDSPGFLKSLQGRNYAANFSTYGPFDQVINGEMILEQSDLYTAWALGKGPVAPLEFEGLDVTPQQSHETLSLRMVVARDPKSGERIPLLEVRHLCERQLG